MNKIIYLIMALAVFVQSCSQKHDHDRDTSVNDHSNHSQVFTVFTENMELFAELSPSVKNRKTEVIAHFTILEGYQAVKDARLKAIMEVGKTSAEVNMEKPIRPGIFVFNMIPEASGAADLKMFLIRQERTDTFVLSFNVLNTQDDVLHSDQEGHSHEQAGITFLKEQAWKMDFGVTRVRKEAFCEIIPTFGEIVSLPTEEVQITAKHSGIVVFEHRELLPGMLLTPKQDVMIIGSKNLLHDNFEVNFQKAALDYESAKKNFEREKELFKDRIISEKSYLEAQLEFEKAEKNFSLLKNHYRPGGHHIHIEKTGYLKQLFVKDGEYVEIGHPLLSVVSKNKVLIKAEVPQKYYNRLDQRMTVNFEAPSGSQIYSSEDLNGKVASIGQTLNEDNTMLPVYFEVDNPGDLIPGTYVDVFLKSGIRNPKVIIPRNSLIENHGSYFAMVMINGELFEKREVKPGSHDGKMIEIIEGLKAGEYVVTNGAYRVYLASMSAELPEHAHVH